MCRLEGRGQSQEIGAVTFAESHVQEDVPCPIKQRLPGLYRTLAALIVVLAFIAGGVVIFPFISLAYSQSLAENSLSVKFGERFAERKLSVVQCDMHQWFFFLLLVFIAFINTLVAVPLLLLTVGRRFESITRKLNRVKQLDVKPTIDCIVPCYLPNEHEILEETVWHILNIVESPGGFKLWLVYNTPYDMPDIELHLRRISERIDLPHGRKMAVVRAETSKSKAENINLLLPELTGKYTVIYDADHHPDAESLMLLVERMEGHDLVCVQGSTYIRNLDSGLLARSIDAEFFVTHFSILPAMALLFGVAMFFGSNGLWRTSALQTMSFDPEMQTEDIDISVRMLLENHRIDICSESRSGELAPVGLGALLKQRMRWAIGGDQVSIKLCGTIAQSPASCVCKLALVIICWLRWVAYISTSVGGLILAVFVYAYPEVSHCGHATHITQMGLLFLLCISCASVLLEGICQSSHRGLQSLIQVVFVLFYLCAGIVVGMVQVCLTLWSLHKIATGSVGGWECTARNPQKAATETPRVEEAESQLLL